MSQVNVVENAVVGNNALSVDSLPPFIYRGQPVLTTKILADAYETDEDNIRHNFHRNRSRFAEGKHFFFIKGDELKELKNSMTLSHAVEIGPRANNLAVYTARGAARHAKMLDTDRAWDVFELLEENYFNRRPDSAQPVLDGTLTPTMQQELKELVQAKVSAYPDNLKKKAFSQIWARVQRKFKVPRYTELPVSLFGEVRDYVISMVMRDVSLPASNAEPQKAIPEAKPRLTGLIGVWANAYSDLPLHPRYFDALTHRACLATTAFEKELQEIRAEALRPFKENRKCGIASPFDFLMDPLVEMFSNGEDSVRPTYRLFYQAIQGLKWANEILILSEKA